MPAEPQRGLVDTNIVILRQWIDADDLPDEIAISAVTLGELSAGPHLVDDAAPDAKTERMRRTAVLVRAESEFAAIPYDDDARVYGQLAGAIAAHGRKPRRRIADLQIAATAVCHRLPLYTTNPDDYVGLDEHLTLVPVARLETA